jgi:hypothetical protein
MTYRGYLQKPRGEIRGKAKCDNIVAETFNLLQKVIDYFSVAKCLEEKKKHETTTGVENNRELNMNGFSLQFTALGIIGFVTLSIVQYSKS